MSVSEATLQADLQREFLSLSSVFSVGDVTVNDWNVLDGPIENAPYIIIENSDDFAIAAVQTDPIPLWMIPFTLFVRFLDWGMSEAAFASVRQPIVAHLINKNYQAASGNLNF